MRSRFKFQRGLIIVICLAESQGGAFLYPPNALIDRIERDAIRISGDDRELPGFIPSWEAHKYRFFAPEWIRPGELGYEAEIRVRPIVSEFSIEDYRNNLSANRIVEAPVVRLLDVVPFDARSSGHLPIRYGQLITGELVFLKGDGNPLAVKLMSDLGIGPRFHGIHTEGGITYAVMDVIPGQYTNMLRGQTVTVDLFKDLETIIDRLHQVGARLSDAEFVLSQTGHFLLIDADERYPNTYDWGRPIMGGDRDAILLRYYSVAYTDPSVGIAYLQWLRGKSHKTAVWDLLVHQLTSQMPRQPGAESLRVFLDQLGNGCVKR